jgi:hypothetical protein
MTIADNLRHLNAIGMHEALLNAEAPRAAAGGRPTLDRRISSVGRSASTETHRFEQHPA